MNTKWKTLFKYSFFISIVSILFYKFHDFNLFYKVYNKIKKHFFFIENVKYNEIKNSVKIYFGSQGGTAENFAKELKLNLKDIFNIEAEIIDLEYFDKEEIKNFGIRIFIVATYGDGEPTDNAIEFFNWIKSLKCDNIYFKNTKYAIMGLGSKEYIHFNKIAKKLDNYLMSFQAEKISETILGNDDENIYDDFEKWKNIFFKNLQNIFNVKDVHLKTEIKNDIKILNWRDLDEFNLDIKYEEEEKEKEKYVQNGIIISNNKIETEIKEYNLIQKVNADITSKFYCNHHIGIVISNDCLLKNIDISINEDKVNHLVISINNISYKVGDTIFILPKNSKNVISWWLNRLNIKKNDENKKFIFINKNNISTKNSLLLSENKNYNVHEISKNNINTSFDKKYNENNENFTIINVPFQTPCSIKEALEYYCDLTTIPRVNILKKFNCFIKDIEELKIFNFILSKNKRDTFLNICKNSSVTFLEFIEIYMTSAEFEFSPFIQLIPKNIPKAYTISSSPKESKDMLSLTIKKKQYPIHSLRRVLKSLKENGMLPNIKKEKLIELCKNKRFYRGIASFYLTEELKINDIVKFNIKTSKFILPNNLDSAHIIMIATGTGIAPFKGFISEFKLYDENFIKNGIKKKEGKRILFFGCRKKNVDFIYNEDIINAKEKNYLDETYFAFSRDQEKKIYVQDLIFENKELVWFLIEKGAYIYVCGNMNMNKDVKKTITKISILNKHKDKKIIKTMQKCGRYIDETW